MTHHPTAKGIVNAWQNFAVANRVFLKDIPSCCSGLLHRLPTASSSVCCFGFSVSPFPCITVGVISYNLFRFHPAANHSFLRVFIRFSVSHRLSAKEFLHPFYFLHRTSLATVRVSNISPTKRIRVCTLHSFPMFWQCVVRLLQCVA